ncbi:MAG TPA: hypothetical protein VL426_06250 [Candidatus Binatia bacterium]|jgi:hypothetical protein|nr:hypothetical protein [Candidatus Binatia bacterium]
MRNMHAKAAGALAAVMTSALLMQAARAATFDPSMIIDDAEIRRADAMDYAAIKGFLDRKGGLANVIDVDPKDGLLKNGAQLIFDTAQRYKVNPRYILALIQKESSAVETAKPTSQQLDWATGYALCDGCSRTSPLAQRYRGFGRQVDAGGGWIDWYFQNASQLPLRQAGMTITIDGTPLAPASTATAALYSYTPHMHGNRLLWSIWNRWFGDGTGGLRFPDGSLVRNAKTGAVGLVQNGKFRAILNPSVLASRFNASAVIDLDPFEFDALKESLPGRPVRFADLSLVRTETGATYLLVGASKRLIATAEVFAKIGFNPEEVEDVKAADIEDYEDAKPITFEDSFPLGELLRDARTGGVYYAESGVKHPLWDRALLAVNFPGRPIVPASAAALSKLKDGAPVLLADGALVKAPGDPAVYVISGGKKRPIPSEDVFLMFGYKWPNVVTASRRMLALHPDGEPLSFEVLPAAEATP